jgi:two-component system sensor histidine kinase HydH
MDTKSQHKRQSEGKPFRLVKYFASASFLVLIAFSVPFAMFISQGAKDILLKNVEDYAIVVGENLNNLVFQYFILPVISQYGAIELSNKKQQDLMERVVQNAIKGLDIELVKLYDIEKGTVAYSTDPSLIRENVVETGGYKKAVAGEQTSEIIAEANGLWGLGVEKIGGAKKVKTYIPLTVRLSTTGEEYVAGVFEVVLNMTSQYNSIVKLQYFIFGFSILIMALIFFALLLIVHNAEKIIAKRASQQRELEEQLHLAERLAALGEMVAGISHEIKNPLGIIQSTAELLSGMPDADDKQKQLSLVIKEESVRLNNIVTEFLDFARPHETNIRECELNEIIGKNMSFLAPELQKHGIKVYDNLDGRSYKLQADYDLLYRALMNIFINAIQSMDNSGSINIKIEEQKSWYRLEIEDTGKGIDRETIKKVFNPFFTTKEKGTGLGLAIVKKIIEGHKGSIEIDSGEGLGTKVTIYLPQKL